MKTMETNASRSACDPPLSTSPGTGARSAARPNGAHPRKPQSAVVSIPDRTLIAISGHDQRRHIETTTTVEMIFTPLAPIPGNAQILSLSMKGIRTQRTVPELVSALADHFRGLRLWRFPVSKIVAIDYVTEDLKTRRDHFVRVTARILNVREVRRAA